MNFIILQKSIGKAASARVERQRNLICATVEGGVGGGRMHDVAIMRN